MLEPILLIHGFDGAPTDWTGDPVRMPEFLAQNGFDPALVRVFGWGYVQRGGERYYNNTGDLREVAARLARPDPNDPASAPTTVDQLAADSVNKGGPDKITVIAHSAGGLIARYYMSCRDADEFGARYTGKIARLITLGTPHQGVNFLDLFDPFPPDSPVYRWLARLGKFLPPDYLSQLESVHGQMRAWQNETRRAHLGDEAEQARLKETPAFMQLNPGSDFLNTINRRGAMPEGVEFHSIYGDIRVRFSLTAYGLGLAHPEVWLGDTIVNADSARDIPNANVIRYPLTEIHTVQIPLLGPPIPVEFNITASAGHLSPTHTNLRRHPDARKHILSILRREPREEKI
jgi:pimeloyl-ACP methyl ester carboxylesterase